MMKAGAMGIVLGLALGVAGGARAATPSCAGADTTITASTITTAADSVRCLINAERTSRGLAALNGPAAVQAGATAYARQMAVGKFFAHVGPDGRDVLARQQASGYVPQQDLGWRLGEDIGCGTGTDATPRALVGAWMASAPHRAVLLDPGYTDLGIGLATGTPPPCAGGSDGVTAVADLGQPAAAPAPTAVPVVAAPGPPPVKAAAIPKASAPAARTVTVKRAARSKLHRRAVRPHRHRHPPDHAPLGA